MTAWLTGYTPEELARLEQSDLSYGDFFRQAPAMNPKRELITGKVCGVRGGGDPGPLMREIRYLDKLVTSWPRASGKTWTIIMRR